MSEPVQPVTPTPAPSAPAPAVDAAQPVPTAPVEAPVAKPAEAAPAKDSTQPAAEAPAVDKPVDDGKPKDEAAPKKVAPEKYELKLSENSLADAGLIERVADYAKSQGLSQDEASALLVEQEKMVSTLVDNQKNQWLKECQSLPEFAGEKLAEASELSRRALEVFDTDGQLQKELTRFGYGNQPAVLRFLSKVGRAVAEDKAVRGNFAPSKEQKSAAQILYGEG